MVATPGGKPVQAPDSWCEEKCSDWWSETAESYNRELLEPRDATIAALTAERDQLQADIAAMVPFVEAIDRERRLQWWDATSALDMYRDGRRARAAIEPILTRHREERGEQ